MRTMIGRRDCVILWIICLLLLFGCNRQEMRPNVNPDGEPYTIGLVLSNLENPFFKALAEGAKQEAKALSVNLVVMDSNDNPESEYGHLKVLVDSRVDCIIVNPTDSDAVYQGIIYANDLGIPILTVDRVSNGGQVEAHITSDNASGGALIANYLLELTENQGKYAEMKGIEGTSAAQMRSKGFNEVMASKGNMSLTAVVTANFRRDQGFTEMQKLLAVHPDLKALFAHNDEMALGAIDAINAEGLSVLVFGFDGTSEALKAIKAGAMAATVAQQPAEMGVVSIASAVAFLNGDAVETLIYVPVTLIQSEP